MKNLKIEIANELIKLVRESANFNNLPEPMILVLLHSRLLHDNVLRSDILNSLNYVLLDSLDDEKENEQDVEPTDTDLDDIEAEVEFGDEESLLEELEPELEQILYPEESPEDEVEERLRLPPPRIIDYVPEGFDAEAHRKQAREWHDITERHGGLPCIADAKIMFRNGD